MTGATGQAKSASVAAVRDAWQQTLRRDAIDPDLGWEEAGADSLKTLQMVMRLERALGRKIPFELIGRHTTINSLAAALDEGAAPSARALPVIHLVPGVFGDGPGYAALARALADRARVEVIDLPDLDQPAATLASVGATARFVAAAIGRRSPAGDLVVAGNSFGAVVGMEAVRVLQAAGRRVALFINLDGLPWQPGETVRMPETGAGVVRFDRPGDMLGRFRRRAGETGRDYAARVGVAAAMAFGQVGLARRIALAARDRIDVGLSIEQFRHVVGTCRMRANAAWVPVPLAVPALLAISEAYAARGSEARWRPLLSDLATVYLPGNHFELFEPAALDRLVPSIVAAIGQHLP